MEGNVDASANLASAENWASDAIPDSSNVSVVLGSMISAPRVLFADTQLTMKSLQFDNEIAYTLAGQGSVNFDAAGGIATISVLQGKHELQLQVELYSDLVVDVAAGARLSINNGLDLNGHTLTKVGAGELVINNALSLHGGSLSGDITNNVTAVPEAPPAMLLVLGMLALACRPRLGWPQGAMWICKYLKTVELTSHEIL